MWLFRDQHCQGPKRQGLRGTDCPSPRRFQYQGHATCDGSFLDPSACHLHPNCLPSTPRQPKGTAWSTVHSHRPWSSSLIQFNQVQAKEKILRGSNTDQQRAVMSLFCLRRLVQNRQTRGDPFFLSLALALTSVRERATRLCCIRLVFVIAFPSPRSLQRQQRFSLVGSETVLFV